MLHVCARSERPGFSGSLPGPCLLRAGGAGDRDPPVAWCHRPAPTPGACVWGAYLECVCGLLCACRGAASGEWGGDVSGARSRAPMHLSTSPPPMAGGARASAARRARRDARAVRAVVVLFREWIACFNKHEHQTWVHCTLDAPVGDCSNDPWSRSSYIWGLDRWDLKAGKPPSRDRCGLSSSRPATRAAGWRKDRRRRRQRRRHQHRGYKPAARRSSRNQAAVSQRLCATIGTC